MEHLSTYLARLICLCALSALLLPLSGRYGLRLLFGLLATGLLLSALGELF